MDVEAKIELINKTQTEEILTIADIKELLETNDHPTHYIGYEVSGKLHLGTLLVTGQKIRDLAEAGIKTQVYLAQYHGFINKKLGGNWEDIEKATDYYEETFKLFCPKAKMIRATELYHNNDEYWLDVLRFSNLISSTRAKRCLPIMGRKETEKMHVSQYFYPSMQAVDIKTIGADIAHGGMDQRSVHVLARDIYPKLGWKKPVALHCHLLPGLAEPQKIEGTDKEEKVIAAKMSKSKPWTCVFIHDSEEEIKQKLAKAWCPDKVAEANPITEIAKYIIFHEKKSFEVERPEKFGGNVSFNSYEELEKEYVGGKLHPADLKNAVARELNEIIKPLREHFEKHPEFLEVYKKAEITR